ncbi:glycoside hydrolase family 15 protein [Streptomyces griseocarneus]|uniref:glycoside hydrolase family 15 protein n=1 Tax=Streptomyces griseocarneus TaxID=51201 RepID=UPI00167CF05C|nr:glycoside hydrolase family 15 protein [Streptomyces griseocarneus]MBZ6475692.1 glycoside hydrolase family 15 protein [Streptomyces griseocarneus]GHG51290.1 glucoamylase [Streptomyces griseocarneus]
MKHDTGGRQGDYPAIEDHGVIGDLHTVALVGVDGTIDWCCLPRFDAPSVFGSLLDAGRGGTFSVRVREVERTKQMYLPDSNVLLTRFLGQRAVAELYDFMVPDHPLYPPSDVRQIIRQVRMVRGSAVVEVYCRPAFDYARAPHEVTVVEGVGAVFGGPAGTLVLRSSVPLRADGDAATATVVLEPGQTLVLAAQWGGEIRPIDGEEAARLLDDTLRYWDGWLRRSSYQGRYREAVERSALVLKLLVHQPTGALVAAPTTSLPESLGGGRNWDYRYTWVRDAAFTLYALMRLGFTEEAAAFTDWLHRRCVEAPPDTGLQVLYGIDGRPDLPETVLEHLCGYRGSRPVRIGNAAAKQLQLDIHGELMDSVYLYNKHGEPISYELWEALSRQLDWLEKHWEEPDDGIWENRGGRRRFTYSALMTWVAFERAMRIARHRGMPAPVERWRDAAAAAYRFVQDRCYVPDLGAYVQYADGSTLDASLLIMPLVKFAGPSDPRFLSTVRRLEGMLVSDSLVHRYEPDGTDGFPDREGTFNLCSFWYVEALARAGRVGEARYVFEKMTTHANHLGLFAEEIGPAGEALGNFPQAFTHLALISAATNLDRAVTSHRNAAARHCRPV